MTDRTHPDSGRTTGGIVEMLHARIAELEAELEAVGAGGVQALAASPPAPNAQDAEDTALLDWLSRAGTTTICLVVDRPHDGEIEVSTDDGHTGYGKTLRDAIRAARAEAQGQAVVHNGIASGRPRSVNCEPRR